MKASLSRLFALAAALAIPLTGQVVPEQPAPEADAVTQLRTLPAVDLRLREAPLREVLRTLAESAGMPFIGLPDGKDGAAPVDLTLQGNPYTVLRSVARNYGYDVHYRDGIWYFQPVLGEELIARVHKLENITLDEVGFSRGSSAGGAPSSPAPAGGGGSVQVPTPPALSTTFKITPDRLIQDIKALLGIEDVPVRFEGQQTPGLQVSDAAGSKSRKQAMVVYNPDQNSLFVVATAQQHDWVAQYLRTADQPRLLVMIETRFVEVSSDPSTDLGIDWADTMADGYKFGLKDKASAAPSDGDFWQMLSVPTAILTHEQLSARLNAYSKNARARNVQQPRQVTISNREVVLRSVVQEPYEAGTSSIAGTGSSTTTNSTAFIPVGTTINLLPRVLNGRDVELNVLINVSDIIDRRKVGSALIPVTTSRDFTGQAIVESGQTLAVGGLERMIVTRTQGGVPLLKDIPFFGLAFKSDTSSDRRSRLVMFITPTVLRSFRGGVPVGTAVQRAIEESQREPDAFDEPSSREKSH